ncbi:hypothetical protein NQZ79_g6305 [Umbelopsis isabellina]|nr:hypothetical protein NQZ79_g6305 [Umbelopsis isabellina]
MRFFALSAIAALFAAASVSATDERLDYKLKKGQTVSQFCSKWNDACESFVHSKYPNSTPSTYCEAGPLSGQVQVYCQGMVITEFTTKIAKQIGATPV